MHLDPPFLQLPRNKLRGAILLQAQFGMSVDIAANGGEFVLVETGPIECGLSLRGLGHRRDPGPVGQSLSIPRGSELVRPVTPTLVDRFDCPQIGGTPTFAPGACTRQHTYFIDIIFWCETPEFWMEDVLTFQ